MINLLKGYLYYFFNKEEKSRSLTAIEAIDRIDVSKFKDIYSNKNSLKTIDSIYPNISIYNTKLFNAIKCLSNNEPIKSLDYVISTDEIYFNEFFNVDIDLPLEEMLNNFLDNCKNFIKECDLNKDKVDYNITINRNMLILTNMYENLINIIFTLEEYSNSL